MVDESSVVARVCGVNDEIGVDAEHVAVHAGGLILLLTQLTEDVSDQLAGVLANQLVRPEGAKGKEAAFVDT